MHASRLPGDGQARASAPGRRLRTPLRLLAVVGAALLGVMLISPLAEAGKPVPPLYKKGAPTDARVLFILCNWGSEFSYQPYGLTHFRKLWTESSTKGFESLADYWREVSFGKTTIKGSTVLDGKHSTGGWYSMGKGSHPVSMVGYANQGGGGNPNRINKILFCMDAASKDITKAMLEKYQSIVTVSPTLTSTAVNPIDNGNTTIKLSSISDWPTGKFMINYSSGGNRSYVNVQVSSVSKASKTLHLVSPWSLGNIPAGAQIISNTSDDVGYVGTQGLWETGGVFSASGKGSAPYHVGLADITAGNPKQGSFTDGVGDGAHEVGHSFGYNHSRTMATSLTDYNDCWDQMSYNSCGDWGPKTQIGQRTIDGAVGMDAINLETQGWIPRAAQYHYSGSGQHTITLQALSDPNALSGRKTPYLDAHIPVAINIEDGSPTGGSTPSVPPDCGKGYTCQYSNYLTIEYRQRLTPKGAETWDWGAGALSGTSFVDGNVVLHLHLTHRDPTGGYSFLVNTNLNDTTKLVVLPDNGDLSPQLGSSALDQFSITRKHIYLAVNSVDTKAWTAKVTISSSPIMTALKYTGPLTVTAGQKVTLRGRLTVSPSGAPVPNERVTLSSAGAQCTAITNLAGVADCTAKVAGAPGTYSLTSSFTGDTAYHSAVLLRTLTVKSAASVRTPGTESRPRSQASPRLAAKLTGFGI
jgi:hypothetical protein